MESWIMESWILIFIAGLAGLAVGALITYFALPRTRAGRSADSVQKEMDDYKEAVADHFARTAHLVNTMTDSYKDVYEHLRDGAQNLLTEEQARDKLADQGDEVITLAKIGQRDNSVSESASRQTSESVSTTDEKENDNDLQLRPDPGADAAVNPTPAAADSPDSGQAQRNRE